MKLRQWTIAIAAIAFSLVIWGSSNAAWALDITLPNSFYAAAYGEPGLEIELPRGSFTVRANAENNLPELTNKSERSLTIKILASGEWNYGSRNIYAAYVTANGNGDAAHKGKMKYPDIPPAALVVVQDGKAVAYGQNQTIKLEPEETVFFINNDRAGFYWDNSGSQTVTWEVLQAY
ncbi:MAG: hypothetical protein AB4352_13980 [Hormoscilla sp.]